MPYAFVHQMFMLVKLIGYQDPLNKLYGITKNSFWDLNSPKRSREALFIGPEYRLPQRWESSQFLRSEARSFWDSLSE